jgi:hypothetical protein
MSENIIAAAVRYNGDVYSALPPARHSDCIMIVYEIFGEDRTGHEEQGFITSENRFVDRVKAKEIAEKQGQLLPRASESRELFSEDAW